MSADDQRIGSNIARFRGDRSQAEVAGAMRASGYKWAQNTVSAVESGERPLRFAEALALARVLEVRSADEFARVDEFVQFRLRVQAMYAANETLRRSVEGFRRTQEELAAAGDLATAAGEVSEEEIDHSLAAWLSYSVVEHVEQILHNPDEDDDAEIAGFVPGQTHGGNGHWMNVLYDTNMRSRIRAIAHEKTYVEHPEAP